MSLAGRSRGASAAVGIIVSAICIALIAREVDAEAVIREVRGVRLAPLVWSLGTKAIGLACLSWRSWLLLRPVRSYRPAVVVRSTFVAFLGNSVLPFRAGELLRVEYLAREGGGRRAETLALVVFERLLDTFWLLVLLVAVSPLVAAEWTRARSLAVLAIAVVGAIALLAAAVRFPTLVMALSRFVAGLLGSRFSGFVVPRVQAFIEGLGAMRSWTALLGVLAATMGYWLAAAAGVRLWMVAFDLELPVYAPLVVILFLAFGAAIPSSPGYV